MRRWSIRTVHGFVYVERQVNLQMVVRRTADFFGELCLLGIRAAVHVNPAVTGAVLGAPQVIGLDDQRISVATNSLA